MTNATEGNVIDGEVLSSKIEDVSGTPERKAKGSNPIAMGLGIGLVVGVGVVLCKKLFG